MTSGIEQHVLTVPDGEVANHSTCSKVFLEEVASSNCRATTCSSASRRALTDLVGFAAATYLRGIASCRYRTSLVGQVDARLAGRRASTCVPARTSSARFTSRSVCCVTSRRSPRCRTRTRRRSRWRWRSVGSWKVGFAAELNDVSLARPDRDVGDIEGRDRQCRRTRGRPTRPLELRPHVAHALEKVALARDGDELRHGEAVAIGLAFAVRLAEALGRSTTAKWCDTTRCWTFLVSIVESPRTFERHHSWKPWRTIKRRTTT